MQQACNAARKRARERCGACFQEKELAANGRWTDMGGKRHYAVKSKHTCDKDIKIMSKAVALAALEFAHTFEDDRPADERICVANACGACAAIDELECLLGVKHY